VIQTDVTREIKLELVVGSPTRCTGKAEPVKQNASSKEFDTSDLLVILQSADSFPAFHNRRNGIVGHACNHDDAFGSVELGESGDHCDPYSRKRKKIRSDCEHQTRFSVFVTRVRIESSGLIRYSSLFNDFFTRRHYYVRLSFA
jgi:hypothetical protein